VSLFRDQRAENMDALNARIDELAREVATLKSQNGSDDASAASSVRGDALSDALDSALEIAMRRIGITIARGGSLEDAAGAAAATLERFAAGRVESWLVAEAGGGLLGALAGGAGAALFEQAISAALRALKPRRMYLPQAEDAPTGGFPTLISHARIFPHRTERDDSLERSLAESLARSLAEE
jgi:predicted phage tail protein